MSPVKSVKKKEVKQEDDAPSVVPFKLTPEVLDVLRTDSKTTEEIRSSLKSFGESLGKMDFAFQRMRADTDSRFGYHRLQTTNDLTKHKKELDQIVKDLEEAFSVLWPKFEETNQKLKRDEGAHKKLEIRVDAGLKEALEKIFELSQEFDEKYKKLLKRTEGKKEIKPEVSKKDIEMLQKEVEEIEKLAKKAATYEYGSSFQVFSEGAIVGNTAGINLKAGSNVTLTVATNTQGFIDITISATSSGSPLTPTGVVNSSNATFGVTSRPSSVIADGTTYFENHGYTYAALVVTMDNAPSQYIRYYA